jgi:UDP-N-acetyl-D-mannosaminuronate dehydrogenase
MNDYDVVVITTGHKDYRNNETLQKLVRKPAAFMYDTIGVWTSDEIKSLRENMW